MPLQATIKATCVYREPVQFTGEDGKEVKLLKLGFMPEKGNKYGKLPVVVNSRTNAFDGIELGKVYELDVEVSDKGRVKLVE